ncbi:MAG: hypothetical protein KJ666_09855 [Bacteroidetes bacterium]|nr:hypothetical protein [Bacteroidota bacterium]
MKKFVAINNSMVYIASVTPINKRGGGNTHLYLPHNSPNPLQFSSSSLKKVRHFFKRISFLFQKKNIKFVPQILKVRADSSAGRAMD